MSEKYNGIVAGKQIKASDMEAALDTRQAQLPVGTILMYDGKNWQDNVTLIGWYQCNGSNGTPNLTDRFIMGSSTSGTLSSTTNSMTLSRDQMPRHEHFFTGNNQSGTYRGIIKDDSSATGIISKINSGSYIWDRGDNGSSGGGFSISITPTGTISYAGNSQSFDKRPAWYSVIYIKRIR